MSIKARTTYTAEIDGHEFPIPFPYLEDSEILQVSADGRTARLGVLVHDDDCEDPLEEHDEGTLVQFNRSYSHYEPRPDLDDFKRLVRANPGRVVLTSYAGDCHGPGTVRITVQDGPFAARDARGDQLENALEHAGGYYIAPEDVTDPASYAKSILRIYSDWCNGECYGICVWAYSRVDGRWELDEDSRDECWGYTGHEHAQEELTSQMKEVPL